MSRMRVSRLHLSEGRGRAATGNVTLPAKSKRAKAHISTLGVVTLLALAGCASETSDAPSSLSVVASESLCLADAASARIHFRITVSNDGATDESVDAIPWRRYSDNSVNDSAVDELGLDVPAGEKVTFRAEFGYNAEEHRLVECGVKLDGADEPVLFEVVS